MTMKIAEKDTFIHYVLLMLVCGLIMATTSGCSGIELGGRLGVYRVDTYSNSVHTQRKPLPLKCYFVNCEEKEEEQQVQGS
jgi:hypothetical protein